MWADWIDPADRDDALALRDDDRGYTWLTWRGEHLDLADVHRPGAVAACGEHRQRQERGESASYRYDEALPAAYRDPAARVRWLDEAGLAAAVCFPNFGLLWERRLASSPRACMANMAAWNRWCEAIVADHRDRLHPVAHLSLIDPVWVEAQLERLSAAGVRLAMIAPSAVEGRPLSHPGHDRLWSAFVDHAVTPVFHVADQPRVLDDAWYDDEQSFVPVLESVFLWVPPAVALTDLILHGTFDRHPDLRIGVVELSSIWVPQYLLMLDGAYDFTTRMNGRPLARLTQRPSEYVTRHVRVASFSYEDPARLASKSGDLFMCCSDYPHSEGTATPLADYERAGCDPAQHPGLFGDNARFLLRL